MDLHRHVQKILVPVPLTSDFSVPLKQALYFHQVYHSEIILMNVVPDFTIFHRVLNPEKLRRHNRQAMEKLESLARSYFNGNIPEHVVLKVVNGELIPSILKTAMEWKCDMIIIKKAKRIKTFFHFLKSENADKIIAEAVCPVLTIIGRLTDEKIRDILIPVDIFKKTTNKIAWSVSLAKEFGAKLHIVSVLKLDIEKKDSLAFKKCKEIEDAVRKEGVDVNTKLLNASDKSVHEVVLDHAAELNPDMLLIMTHQESILFDNYLGSFAREIIHRSPFPVFSVVPCKETILDGFMRTTV